MSAIRTAARLEDVKFPEFTAKLINDTFDALIGANIRQMESFSDFLAATSKTLTQYITETKDEVTLPEITEFLSAIPLPSGITALELIADSNSTLDTTDVAITNSDNLTSLNKVLSYDDNDSSLPASTTVKDLFDAVAKRISYNKYQILTTMVKMGVLRLVVKRGVIESKLSFSTWESQYGIKQDETHKSKGFDGGLAGKFGKSAMVKNVGKYFKIAGAVNYSNVTVNTSSNTQTSSSGTNINIMGRVEIHFETDYQPLQSS